jgi:hypothetical protein
MITLHSIISNEAAHAHSAFQSVSAAHSLVPGIIERFGVAKTFVSTYPLWRELPLAVRWPPLADLRAFQFGGASGSYIDVEQGSCTTALWFFFAALLIRGMQNEPRAKIGS